MYSKKSDYNYLVLPANIGISGNVFPVSKSAGRAHTIRREDFAYLSEAILERLYCGIASFDRAGKLYDGFLPSSDLVEELYRMYESGGRDDSSEHYGSLRFFASHSYDFEVDDPALDEWRVIDVSGGRALAVVESFFGPYIKTVANAYARDLLTRHARVVEPMYDRLLKAKAFTSRIFNGSQFPQSGVSDTGFGIRMTGVWFKDFFSSPQTEAIDSIYPPNITFDGAAYSRDTEMLVMANSPRYVYARMITSIPDQFYRTGGRCLYSGDVKVAAPMSGIRKAYLVCVHAPSAWDDSEGNHQRVAAKVIELKDKAPDGSYLTGEYMKRSYALEVASVTDLKFGEDWCIPVYCVDWGYRFADHLDAAG